MKPLAPAPVHYRLAPGGGLLLALAALLLALGGVLLAWLLALRQAQQTGLVLWGAVLALAYGGGCVWSWRSARALPSGWLVWNGKCWQLQKTRTSTGQMGPIDPIASARMPSPPSNSAGVEGARRAAFEAAGVQSVAAYNACTLVLDLQRAVLLRLHGPQGQGTEQGAGQHAQQHRRTGGFSSVSAAAASGVWVWASRASDPAHWHALRCALVWAQTQGGQAQDWASGGAAASAAQPSQHRGAP